jgi:glucosylglycerate synthase
VATSADILGGDARDAVRAIGRADLVVGIPCFNNEDTVGGVVTAVEVGLRKLFPALRSVICASDGGSTDRTRDQVMASGVGERAEALLVPRETPVPEKLCLQYGGPGGKGSAVRAILEVARRLESRACAVVDADLRSITPYWLDRLLTPVVHHGYGFVAPVYARHKHDGTITNALAYPVTTALYGCRIRQPIGGEFAFSGELASHFAGQDVWETEVARFGIDIWMTTTAVVEGHRTCQSILGAKLHDPKDPGQDLGPMFRQVVGSLFALAVRHHQRWDSVTEVRRPPTFGFPAAFTAEPVEVSVPGMVSKFVEGSRNQTESWRSVLSEECFAGVEQALATGDAAGPLIDAPLWTRIVYDHLAASAGRSPSIPALVDSLLPLYFARTATFVEETRDAEDEEAESRVEAGVDLAIELKPYLRESWDRWMAREP